MPLAFHSVGVLDVLAVVVVEVVMVRHRLLCVSRRFNEETARFYFRQLVTGVKYCHNQGVCHRDLKPGAPGGAVRGSRRCIARHANIVVVMRREPSA